MRIGYGFFGFIWIILVILAIIYSKSNPDSQTLCKHWLIAACIMLGGYLIRQYIRVSESKFEIEGKPMNFKTQLECCIDHFPEIRKMSADLTSIYDFFIIDRELQDWIDSFSIHESSFREHCALLNGLLNFISEPEFSRLLQFLEFKLQFIVRVLNNAFKKDNSKPDDSRDKIKEAVTEAINLIKKEYE